MAILHLSDIHFGIDFGREDQERFASKEFILNSLIDFLAIEQKNMGKKIQHVIVTGDIAWTGSKKEYSQAALWFSKLLKTLDLKGSDMTLCVGNHDIQRNNGVGFNYSMCKGDSQESIKMIDWLYSYDNISQAAPLIYNYNEFCREMGITPFKTIREQNRIDYSFSVGFKEIEACEKCIRIFAFNTAVFSDGRKHDEDKMWLGINQLKKLEETGLIMSKNNPNDGNIGYRLAIFHHPERYLDPNEICEYNDRPATYPRLLKSIDLALCGHTETGSVPVLWERNKGGKVLTGGATYYDDNHPNSCSIINFANSDELDYVTIMYDKKYGWHKVEEKEVIPVYQLKYSEPKLQVQKHAKLIFSTQSSSFTLLIERYSINWDKAGIAIFNNYCQVDRDMNIFFRFDNGKVDFKFDLAENKYLSVQGMLTREKLFQYLYEHANIEIIEVRIEDQNGKIMLLSNNLTDLNCEEPDVSRIKLLERLKWVEDTYDVRLALNEKFYE